MEVCHNDGDPGNNRASNLRYDDRRGNMRDMRLHGTDSNLRKEACPKRHPYDETNTIYTKEGFRRCRICESENGKKKRQREKALMGTEPKRHGTIRAYRKHGCRCLLCVAAVTDFYRRQTESKRIRRAA
jgi:hypothetical protein